MTRTQNAILILTGLILSVLYFLKPNALNLNASMYLQAADLLLRGQKPYVDFIDINPPLIFYISTIPVVFSSLLQLSVIPGFKILLLAFIFISLKLVLVLFKSSHSSLKSLAFPVSLSFLLFNMILLQNRVYGEREQLFIIALFPYLFLRFFRYEEGFRISRPIAVVIGSTLALLACLKPHFLFSVLALELTLFLSFKNKKPLIQPETVLLVLVPLLYVAHFFLLPTDVFHAFFNEIVPMVYSKYKTYYQTLNGILSLDPALLIATVLVGVTPFFFTTTPLVQLFRTISILSATFLINYFIQAKGWNYHLIPVYFCVFLSIALIFSLPNLRQLRGIRINVPIFAAGLVILFTFKLCLSVYTLFHPELSRFFRPTAPKLYELVGQNSNSGDPVLIISPHNIYNYPMLLQMGRPPGSRYLFHFPISFFAQEPEGAANYIRQLKEDLVKRHPKLVIIIKDDPIINFMPPGFNAEAFLNAQGVFDSDFLNKYKLIHSDEGFNAYQAN